MVTVLPPENDLGGQIGRSFGQGFQQALDVRLPQQYQQRRLQEAFGNLQEGGSLVDQIKAIAPQLLTTPGGAQAFEAILGPLAAQARSQSARQTIAGFGQEQPMRPLAVPEGTPAPLPEEVVSQQVPSKASKAITSPSDTGTLFPQRGGVQQPLPELTPAQINRKTQEALMNADAAGIPMTIDQAKQFPLQENENIRAHNARIAQENQRIEQAQETLTSGVVERARNEGLIPQNKPEFEQVARKAAIAIKDEPDPNKRWTFVKNELEKMENARNGLVRNYQVQNLAQKAYNKILGAYKSKETAAEEAQKFLDYYRDNGLVVEARDLLTNEIGLGTEDAERWLFPPSKEQKREISSFPENKVRPANILRTTGAGVPGVIPEGTFPGEGYELGDKEFQGFKEDLSKLLEKNPDMNLISLRWMLNQDKKYAWQDIAKAYNQLVVEGRFVPSATQEQQMVVTDNAPLPGLAQIFQYIFKGTK